MSEYTLEAGESVNSLSCGCCGQQKKRVWGFVSKDGAAHAIYYALLNVTESPPRIGLSVSVGPWWEGTEPRDRSWVHIRILGEDEGVELQIVDPHESDFFPWQSGGNALTAEQASTSGLLEEFRSVANFIASNDPAVTSYLDTNSVDASGRDERDLDTAIDTC